MAPDDDVMRDLDRRVSEIEKITIQLRGLPCDGIDGRVRKLERTIEQMQSKFATADAPTMRGLVECANNELELHPIAKQVVESHARSYLRTWVTGLIGGGIVSTLALMWTVASSTAKSTALEQVSHFTDAMTNTAVAADRAKKSAEDSAGQITSSAAEAKTSQDIAEMAARSSKDLSEQVVSLVSQAKNELDHIHSSIGPAKEVIDNVIASGPQATKLLGALGNEATHEEIIEKAANALAALSAQEPWATVPIGSVAAFAGIRSPIGWMPCEGQSLKKSDYPKLFQAIETLYGNGNDPSKGDLVGDFNLPDFRGRFLRGCDTANTVGTRQDWNTALPKHGLSAAYLGEQVSISVRTTVEATMMMNGGDRQIPGPSQHGEWRGQAVRDFEGRGSVTIPAATLLVSGGDDETRPTNSSIWWIIRVK